ncbi:hypothetical protein BaRGS_00014055 [Batillaria attramentaria]|uniref:CARD domain-containing protein n=1 Tax=Batillaria attramentaria TaxID=370345 RepID=A0ABD0L5G4_9CAEN
MTDRKVKMNGPPRGKVNKDQKAVLEMEREFLLGELDCKHLVPSLRSKGFLDDTDEDYIRGAEGRHTRIEQNGRLLDAIMDSTPAGFKAFLETLRELNYDQAHRRLRQTLLEQGNSSGIDMRQVTMPILSSRGLSTSVGRAGLALSRSSQTDCHNFQTQIDDLSDRVGGCEDRVDDLESRVETLELHESDQKNATVQRNQERIETLTEELIKTRQEVKRIEAEKSEMKEEFQAENDRLSERLSKTSDEVEEKIKKIARLEKQIEALKTENEKLREELNELHEKVSQSRREVRDVTRKMEQGQRMLNERDRKAQLERDEDRRCIHSLVDNVNNLQKQVTQLVSQQASRRNRAFRPNMGRRAATEETGSMAVNGHNFQHK